MKPSKRPWTRAEKWLFALPLLVVVGAGALSIGPQAARRQLGWPQVLPAGENGLNYFLVISGNGAVVAEAGRALTEKVFIKPDSGTVYLWDARTLRPLPLFPPPAWVSGKRHPGFVVHGLVLSPDGKMVGFYRSGEAFALYNVKSHALLWRKAIFVGHALFSSDGKRLVCTGNRGVDVWRAKDGAALVHWNYVGAGERKSAPPYSGDATFSPDGNFVASIGARRGSLYNRLNKQDGGEKIELRHSINDHLIRVLDGDMTWGVRFSPRGEKLISVAVIYDSRVTDSIIGNEIRCYDIATGRMAWKKSVVQITGDSRDGFFCDAIFSPDGRTVAAFQHRSGNVLLLDAATGAETKRLSAHADCGTIFTPPALAFSPDGKRLFARSQSALLVWELAD